MSKFSIIKGFILILLFFAISLHNEQVAYAQDDTSKSEQILKLYKLLQSLQLQLATLQGQEQNCARMYNFTKTLSLGDKDSAITRDVTQLQSYLKMSGDYTHESQTGYFGTVTQDALISWQKKNGVLPPTGALDETTRKMINSKCNVRFQSPATNPETNTDDQSKVDTSMLSDKGGYSEDATVTIQKGTLFDLWGGRFVLRLNKISAKNASFSKLFDGKEVGKMEIPFNTKQSFNIIGYSYTSNRPPEEVKINGTITYTKKIDDDKATFHITANVVNNPPIKPLETETTDSKIKSGRASINVEYISPLKIKISGTYNDIKSCDAGVQYYVIEGVSRIYDLMTDDSCQKKSYSFTRTIPSSYIENVRPGFTIAQSYTIEMYSVNFSHVIPTWTHYGQETDLIWINADGTMKVEELDLSGQLKG